MRDNKIKQRTYALGRGIRLGSERGRMILAVESNSKLLATGREDSVGDHIGTFRWFRHCC